MNRQVLLLALFLIALAACNQDGQKTITTNESGKDSSSIAQMTPLAPGEDTAFIAVDSANKMIKSYLASIQATSNDTNLHSLIIDANALREYLTAGSGTSISHMKIMLAHRLDYINEGGNGVRCGYKGDGLTVVLAGYSDDGSYIYFPTNRVLDQAMPCPHSCPSGVASADTLVHQ